MLVPSVVTFAAALMVCACSCRPARPAGHWHVRRTRTAVSPMSTLRRTRFVVVLMLETRTRGSPPRGCSPGITAMRPSAMWTSSIARGSARRSRFARPRSRHSGTRRSPRFARLPRPCPASAARRPSERRCPKGLAPDARPPSRRGRRRPRSHRGQPGCRRLHTARGGARRRRRGRGHGRGHGSRVPCASAIVHATRSATASRGARLRTATGVGLDQLSSRSPV